jgi:hypothetical protein
MANERRRPQHWIQSIKAMKRQWLPLEEEQDGTRSDHRPPEEGK